MRLTKRTWNNVLIFSCIAMILIFNTMSNKLVDNAEGESAPVLPAGSMILTVEYPSGTIERLGRNWLVTSSQASLSGEQGQQATQLLIDRWLGLTGDIMLVSSDEQGYRVVIWLAAAQEPRRLWVQPTAGLVTDILSQTTWKIPSTQIAQLTLQSLELVKES
ncbi:MAG: hypothetical protein HRU23_09700 [Gammaproteobacteria bacterium]|nr:hypothetical protein [Gammaproteobacteria bacterium]